MLILAVDTSTRAGSAAVLRNAEVLAEVSGLEETPYSTRLFRDVAALREKVQFSLDQVDLFAVAAGPGSFTGLRVGLTAVKAWAEVHRKPIAAISGLEAIASESLDLLSADISNGRLIASFLDARRGYVFGAVYRRPIQEASPLQLISEEAILPIQEFLELVGRQTASASTHQQALLVSPTPAAIPIEQAMRILPSTRIEQVPAALARSIGRLGYERAQRGDVLDPVQLDANYVRRSDAEAGSEGTVMQAPGQALDNDQPTVVRRMVPADVPVILNILRESPEASLWTTASLLEAASKEGAWVAALGECVVGFLAGRAASDEFEIMNLAVARNNRKKGVGTGLVNAALAWSHTAGATRAFLEVRASNSVAIAFYARLGFKVSGRRPKYYQFPEEDAVLMCRDNILAGSK